MKILIKILCSTVTRTIVSCLLLCASLICGQFESTAHLSSPLFYTSIPLFLFPSKIRRIKFKATNASYNCEKCGMVNTTLITLRHELICALIPLIRIPYKFEFFKGCDGCYTKEKDGRTNAELQLFARTNIIKNKKISFKEYRSIRKYRC